MKPIRTFTVRPALPPPLLPLLGIAYNLRWSWDHGAVEVFRRLDRDLWETSGRNPVLLLGSVDQAALEAAASDDSFLAHMRGVASRWTFMFPVRVAGTGESTAKTKYWQRIFPPSSALPSVCRSSQVDWEYWPGII